MPSRKPLAVTCPFVPTRTLALALLALAAPLVGTLGAADADTAAVMRTKLAASQKLLGALVTADFAQVQTNASTLVSLSGQRGWAALQTPQYELFSTQFRLASEELVKAAGARNMEASASAYNELTTSCVACHKYLRDPQRRPAGRK